jgi:acyl-coenzyme A synthetase/AMP-(fatty) acid ligase
LFSGYIADPKGTADAFLNGGFRTGDVGRTTDMGNLQLSGRNDDVFKVAGKKVSCLQIASALQATNKFQDVAVLPRPYPRIGLAPHAVVVMKAGAPLAPGHVLRELRATLPANHLPRGFSRVAFIPRTGSGKIDRRRLTELLADSDAVLAQSEGTLQHNALGDD